VQAEQWARVKELFQQAMELDPHQRAAFLQQAPECDEHLRQEVERLLREHDAADGFLATEGGAHDDTSFTRLPSRIGPYEIIKVLGEGGMGIVYLARQVHPQREVALKVIRPGIASSAALRRFRHEAQILGWLQHDGIAKVFVADATDIADGARPYFVMEYIRGQPLLDFIRQRQLTVREKLELCAQIADAVHYGHQKGVVHRDLKPGNILVDDNGQPKILDFGVARVTDPDLRLSTMQTDVGQLVGTLAYMSPEQIQGNPAEIDTRTDVYALAVILYEMLTGRLPIPVEGLDFVEAARRIREIDPVPLGNVNRTLRGDVETIIGKALAKEKERRYASADEFALDLRRYLADEPIAARPPDTWYRLRVFTRRHRGLVAGLVAALVLLIAGIIGTSWQAIAAQRERDVAQAQTARTARINEFLRQLIRMARPDQAKGKELSIRDALDAAAAQVDEGFQEAPDIEGALQNTIGNTYRELGVYDQARRHLEAAVKLLRSSLGPDQSETLGAMNNLALVYKDLLRPDLTESLLAAVLESRRRTLGAEHPDTLQSINNMAMLLRMQNRPAEAEPLMREAVTMRRKVLGPDDRATLVSLDNLGRILEQLNRLDEAEQCYREALDGFARTQGEDDPDTLVARHNLAGLLRLTNRFDEAIEQYRLTVAGRQKVLGPNHSLTASSLQYLARALMDSGRPAEAESVFREAIESANSVGSERVLAISRGDLGGCLAALDRFEEAETELLAAYQALKDSEGVQAPATIRVMEGLVGLYDAWGRESDAESIRSQLSSATRTANER
jgi:tetratricopeptide (TPR) repeat protein/tRNA A-37 threonylcarbamoyl transferase component Bud32